MISGASKHQYVSDPSARYRNTSDTEHHILHSLGHRPASCVNPILGGLTPTLTASTCMPLIDATSNHPITDIPACAS